VRTAPVRWSAARLLISCSPFSSTVVASLRMMSPRPHLINNLVLAKLAQPNCDHPLTHLSCWRMLGAALYYDPVEQRKHLEAWQITLQLLSQWMSDITTLPIFKDKWMLHKLSILVLATLLSIPTSHSNNRFHSSSPCFSIWSITWKFMLKTPTKPMQMMRKCPWWSAWWWHFRRWQRWRIWWAWGCERRC